MRIIKLDTSDEFVINNGSASYCQFKRLLYLICHQQEFFFQPVFSMILARSMQTAFNVGAYFHVRVFKSYIYRQHNCFDRMSIRRTAIKIDIFKMKVVRVKFILFKL